MWRIAGGAVLALAITGLIGVGAASAAPLTETPLTETPLTETPLTETPLTEGPLSADLGSATGTTGLAPDLAAAYSLAEQEAHRQGVPLSITSGYRSWAEQQALWSSAVIQYGSPQEAQRWVLPPDRSTHVTGTAIDVGPQQGAAWLETNGSRWGLCRTYTNEWWHFERVTTPGGVCPPMITDASTR